MFFTDVLADSCAERNETLRRCRNMGNITLEEYAGIQADKVRKNSLTDPLRDPEDFMRLTTGYVRSKLGDEAADDISDAMKLRVAYTADHHGSLFCAQTLQGDLLYGEVLRQLGYKGRHIPMHAGGQVKLGSPTYARGIINYGHPGERKFLPVFPYKYNDRLTSYTPAWDRDMIRRFRSRYVISENDSGIRTALETICSEVLENEYVLDSKDFSDQAVKAGAALSALMFSGADSPVLVYTEIEDIIKPLLISEISEEGSLLRRMLTDPGLIRSMQDIRASDGVPLSAVLMRTADERGRESFLELTADGFFRGSGWHGEELLFPADPDILCSLLENGKVFPGLFTIALLIAFERGITFMGGVFQSLYLCEWQSCLVRLLRTAGMDEAADNFASYDCSGYLNGPMFALFGRDGSASEAGPLEFCIERPDANRINRLLRETSLQDSHIIGIQQMYIELFSAPERTDNWYEISSGELFRRFRGNII